jgi:hypothetical protein
MKKPARLLVAGLASIVAGTCPAVASAAESAARAQDLLNVEASGQVTARWYSAADGGQAVAAAIRIDDEFYIEKLQPLQPIQSSQ